MNITINTDPTARSEITLSILCALADFCKENRLLKTKGIDTIAIELTLNRRGEKRPDQIKFFDNTVRITIPFYGKLPEQDRLRYLNDEITAVKEWLDDSGFSLRTVDTNEPLQLLQIDDDIDDCETLKEVVTETGGAQYTSVQDPVHALFLLKKGRLSPDIIILDYNMPCLNGIEVLAELKKNESLRHIPIFMYSTCCSKEFVLRAKKIGVEECIVKTPEIDTVKTTMRRVLLNVLTRKAQEARY